jgi:hypothetical protein
MPTLTPTPEPTQTISPGSPGIYGFVTRNGTAIQGIPLILRFYSGSTWSVKASTFSKPDGSYVFPGAPSLETNQKYYVTFNQSSIGWSNSAYLAYWNCFTITAYTMGQGLRGGDFDIATIPLEAPYDFTTVFLPYEFKWTSRAGTNNDSYVFLLSTIWSYPALVWESPQLGYGMNYILSALPAGFSQGVQYKWQVGVYGPDGVGASFDDHWVTPYTPIRVPTKGSTFL